MGPIVTVTRTTLTPQEREAKIAELRRALAEFGMELARVQRKTEEDSR